MEDEECLPENSSLKLYLQNLGYKDFPVTKITEQDPSSIRCEVSQLKAKLLETIDEDVLNQISIIISTQMLFEEDISKVEKLLSNFKVVKTGMLKCMFKDIFGVAVIFLGFCLFWVIGHYAFFIVSSFYAFTAADYLRRKHFNRSRLKKLTSTLQATFILLKKTIKFIEENRSLEASISCSNNSVEFMEGFDFYNNFKSDFLISINEVINILVKSTQKLIIKIPLCDYIENPKHYLCNNFNKHYKVLSMSNAYEIYLLLQSEFLQRLILSLIPNIKLSKEDGFCELNKILTETCVSLLRLKTELNKKFKFLFFNGIYSSKSEIQFKMPSNNRPSNTYSNELVLNIHETSKTFQKLLLQCRVLEEKIITDKVSEFIEQELIKIQQSLNACQRNIMDSLILFKKANYIKEISFIKDELKIQDEKELKSSMEKLNKIVVGYSDLDPKTEDEIFEAYFINENPAMDLSNNDNWEMEEKLKKHQKKEFCNNVIKELKIKIKEKAKYWKKREREFLKKKGMNDVNECKEKAESSDELSDEEKEVESNVDKLVMKNPCNQSIFKSSESIIASEPKNVDNYPAKILETLLKCESKCPNSQESHADENFFESEAENRKATSDLPNESFESAHICEGSAQNFNQNFLNDISQARQKIFNSCAAIEEELFYASGEDSSSEDNHSL